METGVESDHSAVCLKFAITSIKYKHRTVSQGKIDWTTIMFDERYHEIYNRTLYEMTTDEMSYDDFNKCILKAAELTAVKVSKKNEGWFQFSRAEVAPLLEERNKMLHQVRSARA
jgi:hypothetical protein